MFTELVLSLPIIVELESVVVDDDVVNDDNGTAGRSRIAFNNGIISPGVCGHVVVSDDGVSKFQFVVWGTVVVLPLLSLINCVLDRVMILI